MKKNFLIFIALIIAAVSIGTLPASAASVVSSGSCGANVSYTLDSDGVLTISGKGEMDNWNYPSKRPWYSRQDSIKTVVIESGVMSIGSYIFDNCYRLASIDSLYVVQNCGKTLQLDDYSVSADLSKAGVQTVTVSYLGKTASFDILVKSPSEEVLNFGTVTVPAGSTGIYAVYDENGKMISLGTVNAVNGSMLATVNGEEYTEMDSAKLFTFDQSSFAPTAANVTVRK